MSTTPDPDKYPTDTDRRRFVKGVIGTSVLVAGATTVGSVVDLSTNPSGGGGGPRTFRGNVVVDGPAPRGMPQIPLEVDDEGFLRGIWPEAEERTIGGRTVLVAETELGGTTYSSEWFQYCGLQAVPGIRPDEDQDDYLRYAPDPPYEWQAENVSAGDRVQVEDFADYDTWGNDVGRAGLGKPAVVRWRSVDVPPSDVLPVQVIRSPLIEAAAETDEWLGASTAAGFVASMNKCTHFCCVPGFKQTPQSVAFAGEDRIYCPCHQSVYDPFTIEEQSFVAFPRPDEG